jgi:hypothetical protein
MLVYLSLLMCADINYIYKGWQIILVMLGCASIGAMPVVFFLFSIRFLLHLIKRNIKKQDILLLVYFLLYFIYFVYGVFMVKNARVKSPDFVWLLKSVILALYATGYNVLINPFFGGHVGNNRVLSGVIMFGILCFAVASAIKFKQIPKLKTIRENIYSKGLFCALFASSFFYAFITILGTRGSPAMLLSANRYSFFMHFISAIFLIYMTQYFVREKSNRSAILLSLVIFLGISSLTKSGNYFFQPYGDEKLWKSHYREFEAYLNKSSTEKDGYSMPIYPVWNPPVWYIIIN